MQAAMTGADAVYPIARLEYFLELKCLPEETAQKLTLTTDVSCYNLSTVAISYKAYLLQPLPAGFSSCSLNLFAYHDCVEVTNDSGPLKQDAGLCIEILNLPEGGKSAKLVCDK